MRSDQDRTTAIVGFAAIARGSGVAYAVVHGPEGVPKSLVRVGFRCRPLPALHGRDVAYAALNAMARELHEHGYRRLRLGTNEAGVVRDLDDRRPVAAALAMPYVALRCTLNRFDDAAIAFADDRTIGDLAARARAEVCLNAAA